MPCTLETDEKRIGARASSVDVCEVVIAFDAQHERRDLKVVAGLKAAEPTADLMRRGGADDIEEPVRRPPCAADIQTAIEAAPVIDRCSNGQGGWPRRHIGRGRGSRTCDECSNAEQKLLIPNVSF
jgi:hypothetical protein